MGVFPLADIRIRFSMTPCSRASASVGANGWTNGVWWYPHPTTAPRGDAAAAHSPTDSLKPSDPTMRCSDTGRHIRPGHAGRTYRSAPAVPELAAGNGLQ